MINTRNIKLLTGESPYIGLDVSGVNTITHTQQGAVTIQSLKGGVDGQKIDLVMFGLTSELTVTQNGAVGLDEQDITNFSNIATYIPASGTIINTGTFYFDGLLDKWIFYHPVLTGGP